ncbi:alpha/beta-hydrolase [Hesseltinella vesiculosa]|uniref:Carboxypeptidase n=1 Tax=Hesseltinella vesiculosa TaxID=101127 RepID=A0A1X2GR95_9FUNG|nr:alpha/beta-hydrolase [Hesseltinella vesiculosa]
MWVIGQVAVGLTCFVGLLSVLYQAGYHFGYIQTSAVPQWLHYQTRFSSSLPCDQTTQVAGYIDFPDTDDHYFFLYYPAQRNHTKISSTILWLNGGPGCSSVQGAWSGVGPCTLANDTHMMPNRHSWNKHANLLFLDQPIGVGFSHGKARISQSSQAAEHIYSFLQAFFDAFPEALGNHFVIAGESYAGHYLPALSDHILAQNERLRHTNGPGKELPLDGIYLGNGWVNPKVQANSFQPFGCGNQPAPHLPVFDAQQCEKISSRSATCQKLMSLCYAYDSAWACAPAGAFCLLTQLKPIDWVDRNPMDVRGQCLDGEFCFAFERTLTNFARNPHTHYTLGIDHQTDTFSNCRTNIDLQFMMAMDHVKDATASVRHALHNGIHVLAVTGDTDWLCNWMGTEAWLDAMEWNGQSGYRQAKGQDVLNDSKQSVGWAKSFDRLSYVRVAEAGHMAAWDQPALVEHHVSSWLRQIETK